MTATTPLAAGDRVELVSALPLAPDQQHLAPVVGGLGTVIGPQQRGGYRVKWDSGRGDTLLAPAHRLKRLPPLPAWTLPATLDAYPSGSAIAQARLVAGSFASTIQARQDAVADLTQRLRACERQVRENAHPRGHFGQLVAGERGVQIVGSALAAAQQQVDALQESQRAARVELQNLVARAEACVAVLQVPLAPEADHAAAAAELQRLAGVTG